MGRDKGSRRRRAARWLSGSSLTPRPGGPLTEDTAGSEAEALRVPYERHGAWGATGAQGEADSEWGTQEAPSGLRPGVRWTRSRRAVSSGRHTAARARREEEVSGPAAPRGPCCRTSADGQPPGAPGRLTLLPRPQAPRLTRRRSQRKDTRSFSLKSTFKRNKTRVLPRNVPSFVGNKNKEKEKHSHDCSKRAEPRGGGVAARVTGHSSGSPRRRLPHAPMVTESPAVLWDLRRRGCADGPSSPRAAWRRVPRPPLSDRQGRRGWGRGCHTPPRAAQRD